MKNHQASGLVRRQRGLSLLEAMVSLGILAAVVTGTMTVASRYSDDTRAIVAAQHLEAIGQAAESWIQDNRASYTGPARVFLKAGTAAGFESLDAYLPPGLGATNGYGHETCVIVNVLPDGAIEALAVADHDGTGAHDDATLALIANSIGASGGGVYAMDTTRLLGSNGGWDLVISTSRFTGTYGGTAMKKCSGSAGTPLATGTPVMALWMENAALASPFLYRDAIPGHPELNRMNAPLDMGGNRLGGLVSLMDSTVGGSCSGATSGRFGVDGSGNTVQCNGTAWVSTGGNCGTGFSMGDLASNWEGKVYSCQGTTWREQGGGSAFWGDPVANFAGLPACGASSQGATRIVRDAADGANRPRAYTCYGAAWVALALDNSGNLNVPGIATAAMVRANNAFSLNGVTVINGSRSLTNITHADIAGTATINKLAGNLEVTVVATEGGACTPNGRVARNTDGLLLSCQSGVWKKAAGESGTVTQTASEMNGRTFYFGQDGSSTCNGNKRFWRVVFASNVGTVQSRRSNNCTWTNRASMTAANQWTVSQVSHANFVTDYAWLSLTGYSLAVRTDNLNTDPCISPFNRITSSGEAPIEFYVAGEHLLTQGVTTISNGSCMGG